VATLGGCEIVVYGVRAMLDLHPEWVVLHVDVRNMFNSTFQTTIFQELQSSIDILDQLFPFVCQFYLHPFPIFFWKFLGTGITMSFHPGLVHNKRILWVECCLH
jgi:hypothetical protein